jgi:hypothetical protein
MLARASALGGQVAGGLVGRALVELHDDVAVQHGLDLHADLGREEQLVAVDRAGERTPSSLILRISPSDQTWKPPESVRMGLVPVLEAVQAAELRDHVQPGPQPQVEGVAQDDLRAHGVQAAAAARP